MKLAASNIGWAQQDDAAIWQRLKELGFTGIEIAPTRLVPERPYSCPAAAALFAGVMQQQYGLEIPSMQSIWYGQTGNIFDAEQARELEIYTLQAIEFAASCRCRNLVFGCPRNRNMPQGADPQQGEDFLKRIAWAASQRQVVIGLEANPPLYNTNYINTTQQAFELAKRIDSPGLGVTLDMGTMIANGEQPHSFAGFMDYVSHVHISEPGLAPIEKRAIHRELALLLGALNYQGYVSVEMKTADTDTVRRSLEYVAEVFGA